MTKPIIQQYINNLRRLLTPNLKPNIGLEIETFNCGQEGAVLVIRFNPGGMSIDKENLDYHTIAEVLSSLKQNFIGGNIEGAVFRGTNMMMDPNRIIIIKDNEAQEWSMAHLVTDVEKIIKPPSKTSAQ